MTTPKCAYCGKDMPCADPAQLATYEEFKDEWFCDDECASRAFARKYPNLASEGERELANLSMTQLIDRLRGIYPIGPADQPFGVRRFKVGHIQHEAAYRLEMLSKAMTEKSR